MLVTNYNQVKMNLWSGLKKDLSTKIFYFIVFIDTANLFLQYDWFYADGGVWPLTLAMENNPWLETLGKAFSIPWHYNPVLFFCAFSFLIFGLVKEARAWTSFGLAVSLIFLQKRNMWILDGGDFFIIIFLFWHALFKLTPSKFKKQIRYAFALQLVLIYVENALLKNGPSWKEWGTALNIIWGQTYISHYWIKNLVEGVDLKWLTVSARYMELCLPFLLLFRIYRPTSYIFILYHLVIALTIKIGLFSWVNMAGWVILLFPPEPQDNSITDRRMHWAPILSYLWLVSSYLQGFNLTYFHQKMGAEFQNFLQATYVAQKWGMFCPDPRSTSYEYSFVCLKNKTPVACSEKTQSWSDTENWGRRRKQFMIKLAEKKSALLLHQGFQRYLCKINPQADEVTVTLKVFVKSLQFPKIVTTENQDWPVITKCLNEGL